MELLPFQVSTLIKDGNLGGGGNQHAQHAHTSRLQEQRIDGRQNKHLVHDG